MPHKLVGGRLVGKKVTVNLILKYCHLNLEHVEVVVKKKYSEEVTAAVLVSGKLDMHLNTFLKQTTENK